MPRCEPGVDKRPQLGGDRLDRPCEHGREFTRYDSAPLRVTSERPQHVDINRPAAKAIKMPHPLPPSSLQSLSAT